MGRQIAIALSNEGERELLAFLRQGAEISILETFAPSKEKLWVDSLASEYVGHHTYYIWNRAFSWEPKYGQVGPAAQQNVGWWYVTNKGDAPVLEYVRAHPITHEPGRLYWGKTFSAPNGLQYDAERFSQWIDGVWTWTRKVRSGKNRLTSR